MKKLAALAIAALLTIASASAQAADWPMFRANVNRTGTDTVTPSTASFSGQKEWTIKLPDAVQSSPAIYNDSIAIFGSNDGNVYALDLYTGSTVWTFHTGNWGHVVSGGRGRQSICRELRQPPLLP